MTQPEALRLADDRPSSINDDLYQWALDAETELRRLQGLIDDCAIYLKEGETPAQRIARDHGDSIALMELLAREKRKNETLLGALKVMARIIDTMGDMPDGFIHPSPWRELRCEEALAAARAAIAAVEQGETK